MQWNLNLQYELPDSWLIDAAYAGNGGVKLLGSGVQFNQLPNVYQSLGDRLNEQVANPFFGVIPSNLGLGRQQVSLGQLLRPYPHFSGLNTPRGYEFHSTYHALQIKMRKRYTSGLQLLGAYTWSKMIDDVSSVAGFVGAQNPGYTNHYDKRLDKSLSGLDVAHRLVINYQYELPFGKGNALFNRGGWVNQVMGGWNLNRRHDHSERPAHRGHFAVQQSQRFRRTPDAEPGRRPGGRDVGTAQQPPGRPVFRSAVLERERIRAAGGLHLRQHGQLPAGRPRARLRELGPVDREGFSLQREGFGSSSARSSSISSTTRCSGGRIRVSGTTTSATSRRPSPPASGNWASSCISETAPASGGGPARRRPLVVNLGPWLKTRLCPQARRQARVRSRCGASRLPFPRRSSAPM